MSGSDFTKPSFIPVLLPSSQEHNSMKKLPFYKFHALVSVKLILACSIFPIQNKSKGYLCLIKYFVQSDV